MTEAEAWELLNAFNNAAMDGMTIYLSIVSSYLIVAFLAGKKLTSYQVSLISIIFVFFAMLFVYAISGYLGRAYYFGSLIPNYGDLFIRQRPEMPYIFAMLLSIGVLASLVFMWQIRHSDRS